MEFKTTRLYYNESGNIEYKCQHWKTNADTADNKWIITKFTYTDSKISNIQVSEGKCDDRVSLNW